MIYIFFALFFVIELVDAWQSRSIRKLVGKYMLWFWLSIFITFVIVTRRLLIPEESVRYVIIDLICSMLGTFSFAVYMLLRGTLTVFRLSREGEQHPTCLAIKKWGQRPFWLCFFVAVMTLFSYSGRLYALLVF